MMYEFRCSKAVGRRGEQALDRYWQRKGVSVRRASAEQQAAGIDRTLVARNGLTWTAEYKTDHTAASSGHAFIETTVAERPGWAQTSKASLLLYYVPGKRRAYLIRMKKLRERIAYWEKTCESRTVQNHRYAAAGLLVPLAELAAISTSILDIEEE